MVHDFRVKAPQLDRERESKRSGTIFTLEMKQYRVSGDKPGFLSELRIKPLGSSQEHAPFLFFPPHLESGPAAEFMLQTGCSQAAAAEWK